MTLEEFVGLDPNKIRRDKELMQLYINFYEAAFFIIPNCAGCSFKGGFQKLKHYTLNGKKNINFDKNIIEMKNSKTFLLKPIYQTKILTFKKDGKIHRSYGYSLTEDFANELVKAGKGDYFNKLPKGKSIIQAAIKELEPKKGYSANVVTSFELNYNNLDYRKEVLPMYSVVKDRTGNKAKSQKKADIIKFLQDNEG